MRVRQRAQREGRRAAAGDLRPLRLGRAAPTLVEVGAPEVWVTHGREEALIHEAAKPTAARPRPAPGRLRRRGERIRSAPVSRSGRRPGRAHDRLRRAAGAADVHAGPAGQGRPAAPLLRDRARPRPRHRPRGADRRAVVPGRQAGADPRAGREPHRPRAVRLVVRLRGRPGRDGGADLAGAPDQRRPAAADRGGAALPTTPKAELPALVAGWLDASRPPSASRS